MYMNKNQGYEQKEITKRARITRGRVRGKEKYKKNDMREIKR